MTQPDSIVPDQNNSQAWDRYAYALNNPVRYNDPTGHCPWCIGAVVGGLVGGIGSIGYQMIESYASGESNNLQEAFKSVDWKTVATYTVAGAVAGGTFGAINPAATIAGAAVAGSISSVAGGQAAALTEATWEVGEQVRSGETPETSYGMEFIESAHEAGFLDGEQMLWDAGTGAIFGGLGQGVVNVTNSTGGVVYVTQAARSENAFLPGIFGAGTRAFSEAAKELTNKWLDRKFRQLEEMSQ